MGRLAGVSVRPTEPYNKHLPVPKFRADELQAFDALRTAEVAVFNALVAAKKVRDLSDERRRNAAESVRWAVSSRDKAMAEVLQTLRPSV